MLDYIWRYSPGPASLAGPELVRASKLGPARRLPALHHLIPVPKADSVIVVEVQSARSALYS